MKTLAAPSLALLALASGLSACADGAQAPLDPAGGPRATLSVEGAEPVRHLLGFEEGTADAVAAQVAARGGVVQWIHAGAGVALVSGLDDASAAGIPGVALAARDAEMQAAYPAADGLVTEAAAGATGDETAAASQSNPTTAFFYPRQWHLRNVEANAAWAAGKLGSPSVSVAVLDGGLDYTYPDLDGLVDLQRSRSLIPDEDGLVQALFPGRHPITDLQYHGTHVASLISSEAGNVAGVASRVTLFGVKVLRYSGSGPTAGVLEGVLYAADADADVINMSLGAVLDKTGQGEFNAFLNRVFNYAFRQGSVVVVSSNNQATDFTHNGDDRSLYCDMPHVICVSATTPTGQASVNGPWTGMDTPAPYSNYGSPITVAGPGGTSPIPVWGACPRTSIVIPVCRTGIFTIGVFGTSQAAPHVSGLAALLVSEIGKDRPSQVAARIKKTADDLGQTGKDQFYGHGRINVRRALGL